MRISSDCKMTCVVYSSRSSSPSPKKNDFLYFKCRRNVEYLHTAFRLSDYRVATVTIGQWPYCTIGRGHLNHRFHAGATAPSAGSWRSGAGRKGSSPDGLLQQTDLLLQHGHLATDALLGHLARRLHLLQRLLRLLAGRRAGVRVMPDSLGSAYRLYWRALLAGRRGGSE